MPSRVKRKKISFFHVLCLFRLRIKKNLFKVTLLFTTYCSYATNNCELLGGKISRLIDFRFLQVGHDLEKDLFTFL